MAARKKINSNGKKKNSLTEKVARLRVVEDNISRLEQESRFIRDSLKAQMKVGDRVKIPSGWVMEKISKMTFYMNKERALDCLSQSQYIAYSRPDIAELRKAFGDKWMKKNANKAEKIEYVVWEGKEE